MTKVKELDFKGTTIFCGLDVHKISWRVNIRDTELELKDFTEPVVVCGPYCPPECLHLIFQILRSVVRFSYSYNNYFCTAIFK